MKKRKNWYFHLQECRPWEHLKTRENINKWNKRIEEGDAYFYANLSFDFQSSLLSLYPLEFVPYGLLQNTIVFIYYLKKWLPLFQPKELIELIASYVPSRGVEEDYKFKDFCEPTDCKRTVLLWGTNSDLCFKQTPSELNVRLVYQSPTELLQYASTSRRSYVLSLCKQENNSSPKVANELLEKCDLGQRESLVELYDLWKQNKFSKFRHMSMIFWDLVQEFLFLCQCYYYGSNGFGNSYMYY